MMMNVDMNPVPPKVIGREACLQDKGHFQIMKNCSKAKVLGKKRQGKWLIKNPIQSTNTSSTSKTCSNGPPTTKEP